MPADQFKGIVLTPAKLSFLLGLFTLVGAGWSGASYLKDRELTDVVQNQQITRLESGQAGLLDQITKLNENMGQLNGQMIRLTTVLEGIQQRADVEHDGSIFAANK